MNWTSISDTQTQHRAAWTVQLARGLRDNALYAAGGIWQPWDMVEPSDAADGVFYDHAADGDVSSIETPTFVADYDYMLVWSAVSHNNGSIGRSPEVQLYRDADAAFAPVADVSPSQTNGVFYGRYTLLNPAGWARPGLRGLYEATDNTGEFETGYAGHDDVTVQTCSRARFAMTSNETIRGGKLMLLRRRTIWRL